MFIKNYSNILKLRERVPSSFFISYCLLQIINGISSAHTQLPDVGRKNNNKGISPRPNFSSSGMGKSKKYTARATCWIALSSCASFCLERKFSELFRSFSPKHAHSLMKMARVEWVNKKARLTRWKYKSQKSCYVFLDPHVCVINIFAKMSRRKTFRISLGLLRIYFWHFSRS